MNDNLINIRTLQHYMYCPRRYGLLELNCDWAENAFVAKANIMHQRVHSGEHSFNSQSKIVQSSVSIYNDEYNIFGVADCIEFIKDKNGTFIPELGGNFKVRIIEYKPKPPKKDDYHLEDAIQVFAQKLCADYIWKCDSEAYIYYSETRKRVKLPFDTEYDYYNELLLQQISGIKEIIKTGAIPAKRKSQKCTGCSLKDSCFSKSKLISIQNIIKDIIEEG